MLGSTVALGDDFVEMVVFSSWVILAVFVDLGVPVLGHSLLTCPLLCMSREVPQVQFLDHGDMPFELCLPSECGLGMSLDFVVPVSSGKYSWTFVSTAPVANSS